MITTNNNLINLKYFWSILTVLSISFSGVCWGWNRKLKFGILYNSLIERMWANLFSYDKITVNLFTQLLAGIHLIIKLYYVWKCCKFLNKVFLFVYLWLFRDFTCHMGMNAFANFKRKLYWYAVQESLRLMNYVTGHNFVNKTAKMLFWNHLNFILHTVYLC